MSQAIGSPIIPGVDISGNDQLKPENSILKILNGPQKDKRFPLTKLKILIGRNDPPAISVDIDLSECEIDQTNMKISRRHSELQWENDGLYLIDLPNKNGTWVNNKEVIRTDPNGPSEPVPLQAGSIIRFANLEAEIITK